MENHRIFTTSFASVYPHYINKVERKGHTKAELDEIIIWLTGYNQETFQQLLDEKIDFKTFFEKAPQLNSNISKLTSVICGYQVEDIENPLKQKIRYLDKLVAELANGKSIDKILRSQFNYYVSYNKLL
jgi:hypothetical protein